MHLAGVRAEGFDIIGQLQRQIHGVTGGIVPLHRAQRIAAGQKAISSVMMFIREGLTGDCDKIRTEDILKLAFRGASGAAAALGAAATRVLATGHGAVALCVLDVHTFVVIIAETIVIGIIMMVILLPHRVNRLVCTHGNRTAAVISGSRCIGRIRPA